MRRSADLLGRLRRRGAQLADQVAAPLYRQFKGNQLAIQWNGQPRLALLTVNFHTTHYLKMMLLSLAEQSDLKLLDRLVVVDNGSRDGGLPFLRELAERSGRIELVENHRWTHHARGMRLALAALDRVDEGRPENDIANVVLFCDPDVVFLRPETLQNLAQEFHDPRASHAGEMRTHLRPLPEAQASFLAVRRDWLARKDISPWVNHGSPAWWLQRDLIKQGGKPAHFPSHSERYVVHRGRSAVAATRVYAPGHAYARASNYAPHFMGMADGKQVWDEQVEKYADWLAPGKDLQAARFISEALSN